jgi:ABC-type polysaccharide/polyol phosphate export permease
MRTNYKLSVLDIWQGMLHWPMWSRLAWSDVKGRYRRTVLGPFWATLSLGIVIFAMSVVMSRLFNADLKQFLPYLTAGMVTWTLLAGLINEGTSVFIAAESLIKSLRFPLTTLVCALVCRNLIIFSHNLMIYVVVMLVMAIPLTWSTLLLFPALVLVAVNAMWVAILLGIFGARFRDVPPVVMAVLQIVVFVTPIFWNAEQIKGKTGFVLTDLNVFYHFVQLVRSPLLGQSPSAMNWLVGIGVGVLGWMVAMAMFSRFHRRIAYWL